MGRSSNLTFSIDTYNELKGVIKFMEKKICLVCGKEFKYCAHCKKNGEKNTWRNIYCCSECREVFNTCSNFEGGLISQEEAFNKLTELNIKVDSVRDSVKKSVEKILDYKPKKEIEKTEERPKRRPRRKKIEFEE